MMINETIILLIYHYDYEDHKHRILKHFYRAPYLHFDRYLYEPLKKIFSKAIIYDYVKRITEIGVKSMNEEIIALVMKERPKYVLWTSWKYDIQESTLEMIRKEGSIVVGWFFDDEWRFDDYSKWWIPYLDYVVTNAIEAVPRYRELNARVIQTIPNTGIAIDHDWSNIEEKYDVSFVGSRFYADREQWINELKDRNIPIHLFGGGGGGYVSFEQMIDIFKTSKINLNFSGTGPYYWIHQIKGRVFQVCMAGGFMLTEYAPGIGNYFEIDKEIVCFHNAEEMVNKIIYYLDHDEERRAIAQAGWKRAISEYTSFHMVSNVFNEIEQDTAAKDKKSNPRPQKLKIPIRIRMIRSQYHFQWARTLLEENYKECLWKDELALSLSYNPFNIWAWYYYGISFLPSFMRPALFGLYRAMEELGRALRSRLGSIPYLRKMKHSIVRRLS